MNRSDSPSVLRKILLSVSGLLTILLAGEAAWSRAAEAPPLLPERIVALLDQELSGASARRTVQGLTVHHRMRGSRAFSEAAALIAGKAREFGLTEIETIKLPADGVTFYGTQRSRPAWDATFAELWEQEEGEEKGSWSDARLIASFSSRPVSLAQDSASGEAAADLVDAGAGTEESDYAGKDVAGKFVLVSSQPGPAAALAVRKLGAAGIISYAQNQKSAWWKKDETLVRWGHLGTFPRPEAFAFMVSLEQARAWQSRLESGGKIRLRAKVEAGQRPGSYDIVTGLIRGSDPSVAGEEIVFSCHLDHQLPGANDNASGCAAILEAGRTLAKLIGEEKIPRPRRSIRFVWPPEIEGTIALVNARPEIAAAARAVIHMDMVGGDPAITKAVFHVTKSPASLPTFVNDVAEALGRFVNGQSSAHAGGEEVPYPLVDPEGGEEALLAEMAPFSMGSDHQVWTDGSFRVPAIYLNDWPDRYIHTHKDGIQNIDPTKLKRAAFIGAASAYYLAGFDAGDLPPLWNLMRRHALERVARALARADELSRTDPGAAGAVLAFRSRYERAAFDSIARWIPVGPGIRKEAEKFFEELDHLAGGSEPIPGIFRRDGAIYRRNEDLKGPMTGFDFDYLQSRIDELGLEKPALLAHDGLWGSGSEYAYEALNLVDGARSTAEIRDALTAIYGPVSREMVEEFLSVLEKIGVISRT